MCLENEGHGSISDTIEPREVFLNSSEAGLLLTGYEELWGEDLFRSFGRLTEGEERENALGSLDEKVTKKKLRKSVDLTTNSKNGESKYIEPRSVTETMPVPDHILREGKPIKLKSIFSSVKGDEAMYVTWNVHTGGMI